MKRLLGIMMVLFAGATNAHQMTPTYFEPKPSMYRNISVVEMKFFNKRSDVRYYEVTVHDAEWNPLPFSSASKVFAVGELGKHSITIYVSHRNAAGVEYVCTTSKFLKSQETTSRVTSRVCSKAKSDPM